MVLDMRVGRRWYFILLIEQSNVKKMSYKSVTFSNLNFHLIWWQTFSRSRLYYDFFDNTTKHILASNNLNCELFLREKRFSGVPKILFNTNNFVISIRALLPAQHTILWASRWYRYYITFTGYPPKKWWSWFKAPIRPIYI